jgi:hypothetical protein
VVPDVQLQGKVLQRKLGGVVSKILKPEVPKKTTIIRFGWIGGSDQWTSGENTLDESERGEAETPKARIPEVNHDRPIEKDVWHLIFNSRASVWR